MDLHPAADELPSIAEAASETLEPHDWQRIQGTRVQRAILADATPRYKEPQP